MLTQCLLPKALFKYYNCNYLLTEKEVLMGKSQIETLPYWPSDSEVNSTRFETEYSWIFKVNKHEFNTWLLLCFFLQLANQSMHYISYKNKTW